jgi:hypothetical protein
MTKILRSLLATVLAAGLTFGQELTVTISPNPAPLGVPVVVTAQAANPNIYTPVGCLIGAIHQGTPTGPECALFGCTFLPVAIPLYGSPNFRQATWNQTVLPSVIPGGVATPGLYWIEIKKQLGGGFGTPYGSEFFCVTIDDPANPAPALTAVNAPLFGSTFEMAITANPAHAFAPYAVALSFTTNTGLPIPGGFVCLDPDALFNLSLTGDPSLFVGFSGALNNIGTSWVPIQLNIPALAGVLVVPIHAQAVVLTSGGGFLLSNDLPIHIH